jgi:hypothetical protein
MKWRHKELLYFEEAETLNYLCNRPWGLIYVFSSLKTSGTYRKINLCTEQALEAHRSVSCEVRKLSTYKKGKAISVTDLGGLYMCFLS